MDGDAVITPPPAARLYTSLSQRSSSFDLPPESAAEGPPTQTGLGTPRRGNARGIAPSTPQLPPLAPVSPAPSRLSLSISSAVRSAAVALSLASSDDVVEHSPSSSSSGPRSGSPTVRSLDSRDSADMTRNRISMSASRVSASEPKLGLSAKEGMDLISTPTRAVFRGSFDLSRSATIETPQKEVPSSLDETSPSLPLSSAPSVPSMELLEARVVRLAAELTAKEKDLELAAQYGSQLVRSNQELAKQVAEVTHAYAEASRKLELAERQLEDILDFVDSDPSNGRTFESRRANPSSSSSLRSLDSDLLPTSPRSAILPPRTGSILDRRESPLRRSSDGIARRSTDLASPSGLRRSAELARVSTEGLRKTESWSVRRSDSRTSLTSHESEGHDDDFVDQAGSSPTLSSSSRGPSFDEAQSSRPPRSPRSSSVWQQNKRASAEADHVTRLEEENHQLRNEVEALSKAAKDSQRLITKIQGQYSDLENLVHDLSVKNSDFTSQLERARRDLMDHERAREASALEIRRLEKRLEAEEAARDAAEQRLHLFEVKYQEALAEVSAASSLATAPNSSQLEDSMDKNKILDLEAKVAELEREITVLRPPRLESETSLFVEMEDFTAVSTAPLPTAVLTTPLTLDSSITGTDSTTTLASEAARLLVETTYPETAFEDVRGWEDRPLDNDLGPLVDSTTDTIHDASAELPPLLVIRDPVVKLTQNIMAKEYVRNSVDLGDVRPNVVKPEVLPVVMAKPTTAEPTASPRVITPSSRNVRGLQDVIVTKEPKIPGSGGIVQAVIRASLQLDRQQLSPTTSTSFAARPDSDADLPGRPSIDYEWAFPEGDTRTADRKKWYNGWFSSSS